MDIRRKKLNARIFIVGALIVVLIMVIGTIMMGRSAQRDTDQAVRTVSLFFLDELAGRREQVVEANIQHNIEVIDIALDLVRPEEDLKDAESLQQYQQTMRQLFHLERFGFVDADGHVYTSQGIFDDADEYDFDYGNVDRAEVSIRYISETDRHVVIARGLRERGFSIDGHVLTACFMESDMEVMLEGASMDVQKSDATYCNIYTAKGVALSNSILGGDAKEHNLFEALSKAAFEKGYSLSRVREDFARGQRGVTSFTYNGVQETLSYIPVGGTDWMLTYLIRESRISEQLDSISSSIITRSVIQSLLTALALGTMFTFIIRQNRKTARLMLEKETSEAEKPR